MRELIRDRASGNEKPWDAQSQKEAVLDTLTAGITRERRMRRVMMYYKRLDRERLDHLDNSYFGVSNEVIPKELPDLISDAGAKKLALVGLEVARAAKAVQLEVVQSCVATATRAAGRNLHVSGGPSVGLNVHEPTYYRVEQATGKYFRDKEIGSLVVLAAAHRSTVDIEGVGRIANEHSGGTQTSRVGDATFLIKGLPMQTAETFIGSLRRHPVETLDSVMYTAFADIDLPGRSLLQAPQPGQPESNLFTSDGRHELTVVPVPAW